MKTLHYPEIGLPGGQAPTFRWAFNEDAAFWLKSGIVDVPPAPVAPGQPTDIGAGLEGVLWVHADTAVGDTVDVGTGLHGPELANAYVPIHPRYVTVHNGGQGLEEPYFFDWWWWLPSWPDKSGPIDLGHGPIVGDARDLLASDAAARALRDDQETWITAIEPLSTIGADGPIAMSMDRKHTRVVERLYRQRAERLVTATDLRIPEGAALPSPPPTEGSLAIYSRWLGEVFVLGGRTETGAPSGAVWRSARGAPNAWSRLPTSVALGDVIAATISFADGGLYVLDQIAEGGRTTARLLRFDVRRGASEVIGSWPRSGAYDMLALGLDGDGALVFSASSSEKDEHAIIRLDPSRRTPGSLMRGSGALTRPIAVDAGAYRVHGTQRGVAFTSRVHSLGDEPATWSTVGAVL
jgi:hypothetical protein